jgi:hypothetical protein
MTHDEIANLIEALCDATFETVNFYVSNTGEDTEQLDERVMQVGAALRLSDTGMTVLLEVGGKTIRKRLGSVEDPDLESQVTGIFEKFGNGKVDLVITTSDGDPKTRKPIGYVEFKKWKHITGDGPRVAELCRLPWAEFGCVVVLRNSDEDDVTIKRLPERNPNSIVKSRNTKGYNKHGQQCCIVCIAQLAPDVPRLRRTEIADNNACI